MRPNQATCNLAKGKFLEYVWVESSRPKEKVSCTIIVWSLEVQKRVYEQLVRKGFIRIFASGKIEL